MGSELGKLVALGMLRLGWKKNRAHISGMEGEEEKSSMRGQVLSYCFLLGAGDQGVWLSLPAHPRLLAWGGASTNLQRFMF